MISTAIPNKISIELNAFCFTTRLLMIIQLNVTILETFFMMTTNLSQAWHYIGIECLHQNLFLPKILGKQPSSCRASEPEIFRFYYWYLVCISKRCMCADLFFQLKKSNQKDFISRITYNILLIFQLQF